MVNRTNYLLVKEYLQYLEEVMQITKESIKRYYFYLRHLLIWADETLLHLAPKIRPTFPVYVSCLKGKQRDGPLTAYYQKKIIHAARRFFLWAKESGRNYFNSIPHHWIETLRSPRQVQTNDDHEYVKLEEAIKLATFPVDDKDLALRRDQAAAAMLFLSGARGGAFTTLPINAVNIANGTLHQWPELGVKTKNGKKATTFLLQIPVLTRVVQEWDEYIRSELPASSPWYTPINNQWGEQTLSTSPPGKNRKQALNKRLRVLFKAAGLPYKSAHKFRHGHAVYGLKHADDMADYKAVSTNLMHANITITDQIYAPLLSDEVQKRIFDMSPESEDHPDNDSLSFIDNLSKADRLQLLQALVARLEG